MQDRFYQRLGWHVKGLFQIRGSVQGQAYRGDVAALARGIIEEPARRWSGDPSRRCDPDMQSEALIGLLSHVVYLGEREDKSAGDVRPAYTDAHRPATRPPQRPFRDWRSYLEETPVRDGV